MSEIMTPVPFERLLRWMAEEYKTHGSVFGVKKEHFYHGRPGEGFEIFGRTLGSPLGAAAGPHTQLAQNIAAGYVAGLRFMELKTVQVMDGEEMRECIARPCIWAPDEGYNVEWSTELTAAEAFAEYVKAWFLLHVAGREFGLCEAPDFAFNMSVGYTYEGITSPKIDAFISHMADAADTDVFHECKQTLLSNLHLFSWVDREYVEAISGQIATSITLSTLHGCPPEEIEKIARHFLTVKHLHTYIKCNPTLLGYDFVRSLLDTMGYGYVAFDRRHFDADLKLPDAVALIGRLRELAAQNGLQFGVKLTNTFPVQITEGELPGEFMYMSGRALFPLSIHVALRLSEAFGGMLPISFSGGADYFNIAEILDAGIAPVTVATTLLKPGGYARARQLSEQAEGHVSGPFHGIDTAALRALADNVSQDEHHRKGKRISSRKMKKPLPLFDCFTSPCSEGGCPINQQIPQYLALVAKGNYEEAFRVIAIDNALPAITSEICSHPCQDKCTRWDYEEPLHIRQAKNMAVRHAQRAFIEALTPSPLKTDKKAAIIGAGPAGMAAALYLRRSGVDTTVFEKRKKPLGIVQYVIPGFRVSDEALELDYQLAVNSGVRFVFNANPAVDIAKLKKEYDYLILATGAWKRGRNPVREGGEYVKDALAFLDEMKRNSCRIPLGKRVAVIGGGDVAMDCARAAKRAPGAPEVCVVYRRTRAYMPSQHEEQEMALSDGVQFLELLSPVSYGGHTLTAERMALGTKEADGRRGFTTTGETKTLPFDTVIDATGSVPDTSIFTANGIEMVNGYAVLDEHNRTNLPGVYVAGDCRRGPTTIVQAMADSKIAVQDILRQLELPDGFTETEIEISDEEITRRKACLAKGSEKPEDALRCLCCGQVCEICCEVCPNRANVSLMSGGRPQILHLDALCNECGNCGVFCPYAGNPYKDKLTLFPSREAFYSSENRGFAYIENGLLFVRDAQGHEFECTADDARLSPDFAAMIRALEAAPYIRP